MAQAKTKKNIVFFHPDLGIGGAERLVVDAAVGLQNLGHNVTIFTSHCDPTHCFDEARDGTLDVRVRGNSIAPSSVLSRFSILCAVLRQLHLVIQIGLLSSELAGLQPDAFFADQLSACIPLIRILFPRARLLFYCHFPDKLLAYRENALKKFYRIPFDWLESWSTGASDVIAVNSKFTRQIFGEAFPGLKSRNPHVVYPCVIAPGAESTVKDEAQLEARPKELWSGKRVLLSINRFERKKDIGLAIRAFAGLSAKEREGARLVLAGGHDPRLAENVQYHKELERLAEKHGLKHATATNLTAALSVTQDVNVMFLLSVPSSLKTTLLEASSMLVYTPKFEHFGIVPLEAMLERVPVLAAVTGGPIETVVDGETGWSRDVEKAEEWTQVMHMVLSELSTRDLTQMGEKGRKRALEGFSQHSMAKRLDEEISAMLQAKQRPSMLGPGGLLLLLLVVAFVPVLSMLAVIAGSRILRS